MTEFTEDQWRKAFGQWLADEERVADNGKVQVRGMREEPPPEARARIDEATKGILSCVAEWFAEEERGWLSEGERYCRLDEIVRQLVDQGWSEDEAYVAAQHCLTDEGH